MNARRWIVTAFVLLIASTAVTLRVYRLDAVPPGLQHDEAFHGHDAVTVLLGHHALYFPSNAGNEPLYIYLTAGTLAVFGKNVWGLRLAAALCGLATVAFTGLWLRRAYNTRIALIASALMAATFWPLFMSRVGLRSAALPPLAAATAWAFWGAWQEARGKRQVVLFILAGVLLGATLYTYPAARFLPLVYLLFALALYASRFTFHASRLTLDVSRSTLYTLAVAGIVFLPLYLYLRQAPSADVRLQQLWEIGALSALQKGDAAPLLANLRDTLGMFTFRGDPVWRYNLAGRPVFDPLAGALFYLGLVVALWRAREPRYLFALIWLPVGLLPSVLSDAAPSFLRASASLPVTFLFPALGADWLIERWPRYKSALTAAVIGLVALSGWLSLRDYFIAWPAQPEVRAVYRSDLTDVARWLDAQRDAAPVVIATTNPHDVDPFLFDFELRRPRPVKWVDHTYGLILPQARARVISPAYSPLANELRGLLDASPALTTSSFAVYETSTPSLSPQTALTPPLRLGDHLELIGYNVPTSARPGGWVRVWTYWHVVRAMNGAQQPIAIFAHLLNQQEQLISVRDLLAVPTAGWDTGDVWVQYQDLPVPPEVAPGAYVVEIGVYSRADMLRWKWADGSDRLLLPPTQIR